MDRSGALPDRCVVCNAGAGGFRLTRTLYCSPLAWRLGAAATPFVVAGLGLVTGTPLLTMLFWPLVLALIIAHTFVRRKLVLELGLCRRHRRLRFALRAASFACLIGVFAAIPAWGGDAALGAALLWGSVGGLIVLSVIQSAAGIQAVAVRRLTDEHAWLAHTGSAFRAALPELPAEA